jgi:hypothetical protein
VVTAIRTTLRTEGVWEAVPMSLGAVALVIWLIAVHETNFAAMGSLGLISILPAAFYVGLAITIVALGMELIQPTLRERRVAVLVGLLVVYVFATACAVEPTASLPTTWIHAGFVQYIFDHGSPLNGFNAEFSWPGSFSLGALVVSFMGQTNAVDLLRWFPFVIELAYLAPLVAIARRCDVNRRAAWLGVALFYATNWIYQDYFSPQALNVLFFLSVIALVLWVWSPVPLASPPPARLLQRALACRDGLRLRRLRGDDARSRLDARTTLGAVGLAAIIIGASAVSHQLTPYAIFLGLLACLLTRRLGRPELVLLTLVFSIGWLSLGASNYWLGHLSDIFGGFGQFFNTAQSNISSRVTGSSSHRLVVDLRILITAGLFGLAAVGALRRAAESRTLELLAISQFVILAVQSYGGEGLLRVALLSGPFASMLAASAILPSRRGPLPPILADRVGGARLRVRIPWPSGRVPLGIAATVVLLVAAVATTVVRGGNDAYESFAVGEVAAANYLYAHVAPGQEIGLVAPYEPLGQAKVNTVRVYVVANGPNVPDVHAVGPNLLKRRPNFVFLGQAQAAWGVVLGGYPQGWEAGLQRYLLLHGYAVAEAWHSATVLRLKPTGHKKA